MSLTPNRNMTSVSADDEGVITLGVTSSKDNRIKFNVQARILSSNVGFWKHFIPMRRSQHPSMALFPNMANSYIVDSYGKGVHCMSRMPTKHGYSSTQTSRRHLKEDDHDSGIKRRCDGETIERSSWPSPWRRLPSIVRSCLSSGRWGVSIPWF